MQGLSDSQGLMSHAAGRDDEPPAHRQDRLGATATLGDLLYADKSEAVVSEHEWTELVQSIATADQLALHAL